LYFVHTVTRELSGKILCFHCAASRGVISNYCPYCLRNLLREAGNGLVIRAPLASSDGLLAHQKVRNCPLVYSVLVNQFNVIIKSGMSSCVEFRTVRL
jgi:hypothetical protein